MANVNRKQTLYPRAALVALATLASVAATGFLTAHWLRPPAESAETRPQPPKPPALQPFADWPAERRPDLAIILSGEMHGYLKPCGCSRPQYGGLERRYNFVQTLKQRGWPILALDLGDVPQRKGPAGLPNHQGLIKYRVAMKALDKLGCQAVGIGEYEMAMPLVSALAEYSLNFPTPRVLAANLIDREKLYPGMLWSSAVATGEGTTPRVGIIGVVGPSVAGKIKDPDARFAANTKVLPAALDELQKRKDKPEFYVLLYQGSLKEARACAEKFPQFNLILALSDSDTPPDRPEKVGETLIVSVGHKGRYIGVLGVFRTAKGNRPFDLFYQLLPLGEEYETPEKLADQHPILQILEDYTRELKDSNYLARYEQRKHPLQVDYPDAEYVGSEQCKNCHKHAYQVWKDSAHSHAYQTLVDARHPSLRQYDPECIVCHVDGFGFQTGFTDERKTDFLKNVGCESCHGPASEHLNDPKDKKLHDLMNPWRPKPDATPEEEKKRMLALGDSCRKCHDDDNDVNWDIKKWDLIIHRTPKKKN